MKALALMVLLVFGALVAGRATAKTETAIVAGGCFWCVESDFETVPGVKSAVSGFIGGTTENPTYKSVSAGGTGHYEAVRIRFDPARVSYRELMDMFFRSIDPTDAGGQFCDRGKPYRTAIFALSGEQRTAAEEAKAAAEAALGQKIVTPILGAGTFYEAEAYHQDYYRGTDIVLTRRGPKRQSEAYKFYRNACGRDKRVRELWGNQAAFAH